MILTIQFCTEERLMVPGTDAVAVYGHLLRIGPGELGAGFPYRSPRDQVSHYGRQLFVLLSAEDESGNFVEHPDIDVTMPGVVLPDPGREDSEPTGVHETTFGAEPRDDDYEEEDEEDEEEESVDDEDEDEDDDEEPVEKKPKRAAAKKAPAKGPKKPPTKGTKKPAAKKVSSRKPTTRKRNAKKS